MTPKQIEEFCAATDRAKPTLGIQLLLRKLHGICADYRAQIEQAASFDDSAAFERKRASESLAVALELVEAIKFLGQKP